MTPNLWMAAGCGLVPSIGAAIAFTHRRRRARRTAVEPPVGEAGQGALDYLAPSIEAAEWQLALLLPRMRAYMQAPFSFAASRIVDAGEFDRCLDLATVLCLRREELSGASASTSLQRERVRDQILLSLSARSPSHSRRQCHGSVEQPTLITVRAGHRP